MKIIVRKWGNSLAVRIPKVFAIQLGIEQGKDVNIETIKDAIVISKSTNELSTLLEQVTADNLHSETDTGSVTGSELW